jgi:hypothetical protein
MADAEIIHNPDVADVGADGEDEESVRSLLVECDEEETLIHVHFLYIVLYTFDHSWDASWTWIDQEILAMKQRVKEMEEEAAKLREMQAAAQAASEASADGAPMETDEDRAAADIRSVYVGNVRGSCLCAAYWCIRTTVFTLLILQVDYGATPEELQAHFQAVGSINRITILCDKFTGHPKGWKSSQSSRLTRIDTSMPVSRMLNLRKRNMSRQQQHWTNPCFVDDYWRYVPLFIERKGSHLSSRWHQNGRTSQTSIPEAEAEVVEDTEEDTVVIKATILTYVVAGG